MADEGRVKITGDAFGSATRPAALPRRGPPAERKAYELESGPDRERSFTSSIMGIPTASR